MSFIKKTWLARIGVGLNRFRMNNSTDVVLESNPISVTQQGDQLSADNMNNLETRIGNAFDEMAGNLATIEVSPSLHNWTVGSQIVYNGILYKVTSAISTDDNLVVGTNIEPYPVSSALSDISTLKSTTFRDATYMYSSASLYRVGALVFVTYTSDFINVPMSGFNLGTLIPQGFRPVSTLNIGERNSGYITIRFYPNGEIFCYNYSGSAFSSMNGQFTACWITTDPLPN